MAQRNLRILVVGINYAPEHISTGKYTTEMCSWLAARGHAVRIVTAPPYYPDWRVWPNYRQWEYRRETISDVSVLRCPLWVPKKPSGLTRLLHLASFGLTSLPAVVLSALAWKPDVAICIVPTLANAPATWLAARLARGHAWVHIQDFELDAMLEMGIVRAGPLRRAALGLERWLLRRFDRVSTISSKMLQKLDEKGIPADRRVLFPNWADIDAVSPLTEPSTYRRELGIPDDAVVGLYSGNMGLKQGLEMLGEAAKSLGPDSGIHFVFGGEGPGRQALEASCQDLPHVHFLPLQPLERLRDWLGLADIHLLPQRADVADLVMPSKLTGMLASGRPVLATALPGTGVAEALQNCGIVVPPGDTLAFGTALRQLADDAPLRVRLGTAARQQAEQSLARDAILARLEAELMKLQNPAPLN